MKKLVTLILLVAILGLIYFLVSKDAEDNTSVKIEDREFVVDNPDDIHVITVKSKSYPLMHLNRNKNYWVLNEKYKADPIVIKNMLAVLTRMKIKYIPPRPQNDMIYRSVEKLGIEIKTYDKDGKLLSDFIMASNTNDESGTYCLKRGARQPYVMAMPILEGGLRNYFNQPQIDLRDKTVFNFDTDKIVSISVDYLKDKKNSFELSKDKSSYNIKAIGSAAGTSKQVNKNLAYAYIKNFDKLMAEYINQENPEKNLLDGVIPFAKITVRMSDNQGIQLDLFPELDIFDHSVNTRSVDDLGKVESYFVKTGDGEDFIVQHRLISKCLKTIDYFIPS